MGLGKEKLAGNIGRVSCVGGDNCRRIRCHRAPWVNIYGDEVMGGGILRIGIVIVVIGLLLYLAINLIEDETL